VLGFLQVLLRVAWAVRSANENWTAEI